MNRTIRLKKTFTRPIAGGLAILLTLSLTVPVSAVVFTNSAPITINDPISPAPGTPYPSNITVGGLGGTISNVTVRLQNINHTFPADIDILLVGPTGGNILLMSDSNGSDDTTNATLTFDDAAATTIPASGRLSTGSYKPTNVAAGDIFPAPAPAPSANTTLAAAFTGDPNGTWSLYTVDDLGGDMGTIGNGWSLSVTTSMNPSTTFTNGSPIFLNDTSTPRASLYPSPITVSGLTGAITDVNVTITNLNHTFPDDVDILLVGSTGKRIVLMSDAGGSIPLAGVTFTIDDEAGSALPDSGAITAGSFRPANYGAGDLFADQLGPYPNPLTAAGAANAASLSSVFDGTDPNGTWSLYVTDSFTPDPGDITGGWSVDITAGGSYGAKRFTNADYDGDGKSDVAVQRPSTNEYYWRESAAYANRAFSQFGLSGDLLVPGDYDGDRKADIAVFRPSNGVWYIIDSSTSVMRSIAWGASGDVPVPADYDGDGKYDPTVFRSGSWYVLKSTGGALGVAWGTAGDIPVQGHFEGTNGADFTVFRPSDKTWYILNNAGSSHRVVTFGASGDTLVPGDYDGDGKTDVAVYRGSLGDWYIKRSSTGTDLGLHLGSAGDIPVPGDYDGDSRTDIAVWKPSTNSWYLLSSGNNPIATSVRIDNWGVATDVPIARRYVPTQVVP